MLRLRKLCRIWDKGKRHVAGNANTKTLRKLPIVTEVCVQYSKKPIFKINQKKGFIYLTPFF